MKTPLRNVRVPDELWDAARQRAEAEGRHVSDVVREALRKYTKRPRGVRISPPAP